MTAEITPRRGLRFEHATRRQARPGVRIEDSPPEVCRVTMVRQGTVYYRGADGEGMRWRTGVEGFRDIVGQVLDEPQPDPAEVARRAFEHEKFEARWATSVRTTFVFDCGHVLPESEPIPLREWPITDPGTVTICDDCDEYVIVAEVRTRLVADEAALARLYRSADIDPAVAEYLASATAERLTADPRPAEAPAGTDLP